uniref:WH2 domain-containing protein n=1 Tax=Ascaris lumbricoides TaxID=6252 RepID=A0A9J2PT32_ASCLU
MMLQSGNYTLLKNCGSGTALAGCEDQRSSSEEKHIQTTTHPYIHLKNCTSTRPTDIEANGKSRHQRNDSSGSLSVSSSRASSSADSDCAQTDLPSRNTLESLVPPPRPPKGTHLNARKEDIREELFEIYSNGPFHLDQTLPPPHLDEIGIEEDHGWSGETIKPAEKVLECSEPQAGPSWEAPLPFTMSKTPSNRVGLTPTLPSDSQLIPPKVDRSCKPHRRGVSADETNAPTSSLDRINSFVKRNDKHSYSGPCPPIVQPRKSSEGSSQVGSPKPRPAVPPIPRTNPLNRIQREPKPPAALPPPPTSPPPSSGMLEYFDPIEGVTVLRSASAASVAGEAGVAKVDAPARTAHSVEYVLIDEQSTKAVFEANMQQSELRSMGKPLG